MKEFFIKYIKNTEFIMSLIIPSLIVAHIFSWALVKENLSLLTWGIMILIGFISSLLLTIAEEI